MYGEDVAIVAIVFGSVLAIVFMGIVGSIIKTAIKKKGGNLSENKEFLEALREFKEKTDRRLSNLEAIVAGDEPAVKEKTQAKKANRSEPKSAIEIEIEDKPQSEKTSEKGRLKNMLNQ
jgi:2C-methyl-D-erythritol 2,4-cyclodiphosphate synthase